MPTVSTALSRGRYLFLTWIPITALLFGCRHGNAINFVTNTQFGVKVGVNAEKIPEAQIGYNRQEAARVPVYHETQNSTIPSNASSTDLKFQAEKPDGHGTTKDAYSVLGTFRGGGSGSSQNGTADLKIAQYFATGLAAQLLAEHGGAAMVNPKAKTPAEARDSKAIFDEKVEIGVAQKTVRENAARFIFDGPNEQAEHTPAARKERVKKALAGVQLGDEESLDGVADRISKRSNVSDIQKELLNYKNDFKIIESNLK